MLNTRENYLRALRGETPEYVPRFNLFWSIRPSILNGQRVNGIGKDVYGVEWTSDGKIVPEGLPKPGDFILEDIRRWRDVIKFPDFSGVDWEALAKKDLQNRDPNLPLGGGTATNGFFQCLVAFMGFTEGLIACYEEPEEVRALVEYLCDCFISLGDKYLQYYQPDYIGFGDDIAHERETFISLDVFHQIFEPVWRRYIKFYKDRGYLASHHNCGHFESFLDDVVDMGFNAWDPAQTSNDLVGIKKKYGNKLVIQGGLETRRFLSHFDVTEEYVRGEVKTLMDNLAPGGGFAFVGGAASKDPVVQQRSDWINDEYEKLKTTYYQ
jgi:hypothetical protein